MLLGIMAALSAGGAQASARSAYDFSFTAITGEAMPLSEFAGRVLLIVNTASQCGYTGQYAGLQKLWTQYRARGLTVIGAPSNDFGGQEPGNEQEILGFCSSTYGVTFPLTEKISVRGADAHPFYRWAAANDAKAAPRWNFHKILIDRNGQLATAFPTATEPLAAPLILRLEMLLAAS